MEGEERGLDEGWDFGKGKQQRGGKLLIWDAKNIRNIALKEYVWLISYCLGVWCGQKVVI